LRFLDRILLPGSQIVPIDGILIQGIVSGIAGIDTPSKLFVVFKAVRIPVSLSVPQLGQDLVGVACNGPALACAKASICGLLDLTRDEVVLEISRLGKLGVLTVICVGPGGVVQLD